MNKKTKQFWIKSSFIVSAVTVVAATLDIHPGVAVPGAGLNHLEPIHYEVLVDVVDEAG